jgi:hypothetical protein
MTSDTEAERVAIIQADRDLAAKIARKEFWHHRSWCDAVIRGEKDDFWLVQELAGHRARTILKEKS